MGYVGGDSRGQSALFPVALDELVVPEHPVRVIDAFVAGLDLGKLGFAKAQPASTAARRMTRATCSDCISTGT
jgi:hypothetical protein